MTSELLAFGCSTYLTLQLLSPFGMRPSSDELSQLWFAAFLVTTIAAWVAQGRGEFTNASRELKRHSLSSVGLLAGWALIVSQHGGGSTRVWSWLLGTWVTSLGVVPLLRYATRRVLSPFAWWQCPVLVFGAGPLGRSIVTTLRRRPELGLRPVALMDTLGQHAKQCVDVPIVGHPARARHVAEALHVRHAIVTSEFVDAQGASAFFGPNALHFEHLLVVPDSVALSQLFFSSRAVRSHLVDAPRGDAWHWGQSQVKRILDIAGALLVGVAATPLLLIVAVATKLGSKGPVLYSHRRIGRNGKEIRVWKFRSMVADAGARLEEHLRNNLEARLEWEETQKLTHDPRVTPVGRFLRKTSLDELPQLWNVLRGDMSLVGPRPIVYDERRHYAERIKHYEAVLPGLSGLWQVSGRSDTSYAERVELDTAYVLNWSIWLDLCILASTIPALLIGRGAR